MRSMRAVVTGGSGFIGASLCSDLAKRGYDVLSYDIRPFTHDSPKIRTKIGDITDRWEFLDTMLSFEPTDIYHLAAQPLVGKANKYAYTTINTNVLGTLNVLEAARNLDLNSMVIVTTDKVYGDCYDAKEDSPFKAPGTYETSKVCAELLISNYISNFDLPIAVARPVNVYGLDFNNRIIPNIIRSILSKGEVPLLRNFDGTRNYIYIDDVVSALVTLSENIQMTRGQSYNVAGNSIGISQSQLAYLIKALMYQAYGIDSKIIFSDMDTKDWLEHQTVDAGKIRADTPWRPRVSLRAGLLKTIDAFIKIWRL